MRFASCARLQRARPRRPVGELAQLVRAAGAEDLADRLDGALAYDAKRLALSLDDRAILLAVLEDPSAELAELRGVLVNDHRWRQREGLD